MEIKPILLVKINTEVVANQEVSKIEEIIQEKCNDYHVFVIPSFQEEPVVFEVFYPKDFKEIDFEELKELIKNIK